MKVKAQNKIPLHISLLHDTRITKGIKLEKLAEKLGVTAMTISYWERCKREPTFSGYERWANALGYELSLDFKKKGKLATNK